MKMKTQKQDTIELVKQLAHTIEIRKEIEKQEKAIKEQITAIMGEEQVLEAANFLVTRKERSRTDLDKKSMLTELGEAFLKKFERVTTYFIIEVVEKWKRVDAGKCGSRFPHLSLGLEKMANF